MKKHILLFLCLLLSHLSFSQISVELIGGIGFDIQKYETKYLYGRTPLMHEYTSSNGSNRLVKFEVLEPQNIGDLCSGQGLQALTLHHKVVAYRHGSSVVVGLSSHHGMEELSRSSVTLCSTPPR